MTAATDSLDAATQQMLALMAQLKLSNTRIIEAQDTGAADAIIVNPVPAVAAIGPDLLLLADIAHANATTTPTIAVSGLAAVPLALSDGSPVPVGALSGKCLIGFASLASGGYGARLLTSAPGSIWAAIAALQVQSPKNALTALAFSPNVVAAGDLGGGAAAVPSLVQSLSVTGASWIDANGAVSVKNMSATFVGFTAWLTLEWTGGSLTGPYIGGMGGGSVQIPLPVIAFWQNLNTATTYTIKLWAMKNAATGPVLALDARIGAKYSA